MSPTKPTRNALAVLTAALDHARATNGPADLINDLWYAVEQGRAYEGTEVLKKTMIAYGAAKMLGFDKITIAEKAREALAAIEAMPCADPLCAQCQNPEEQGLIKTIRADATGAGEAS